MKFSFFKNSSVPVVRYNDHSLRIVLSLIAAHIMVLYNDSETFFEAVVTRSYLRGLAAGFVIAYIVTYYIYRVTVRLDKKYDWHTHTFARFFWQCWNGVLVPAVLVFLLVGGFLALYGINILKTEYLRQDYPLTLLMLLSFNLYYFGLYCYIKLLEYRSAGKLKLPSGYEEYESTDDNYTWGSEDLEDSQQDTPKENLRFKEVIMVETPTRTLPVATDDIAYTYLLGGTTFLRLKNMENLAESYQTNYSLKDLETLLDPSKFFRINRQMTVNHSCISFFRTETAKTLLLSLDPEPYPIKKDVPSEHQKLLIVSETRTPRFKVWMDR